jgi:ATP-binding cassette subfamily C (CFTR/MRP) protein 1
VDENMKAWFASVGAERWLSYLLDLIGTLIQFFAALFAVLGTSLTPGDVGLSISHSMAVTFILGRYMMMLSEAETSLVAVERIKEYCQLEEEEKPNKDSNKKYDDSKDWPENGATSFENYSVRYREGLDLVLHDVTLDIKDGETVGIVGRTGAGKSSLTLALFRIIEAATGSIRRVPRSGRPC